LATVDTKLVEEISSELLLVKAENIQLLELIVAKDTVIQKLDKKLNAQETKIRASKLNNKRLFKENKELEEKFALVQDYLNEPVVKDIMREIKQK